MKAITATKKEKRNNEIESHIFKTATKLIKRVGYENLSIRTLCEQAGVSTGMFYRHFQSKDDLLAFYFDETLVEFEDTLWPAIKDEPLEQQLIISIRWLCQFTEKFGLDFVENFYNSKNKIMHQTAFTNKIISILKDCVENAVRNGFQLSPSRTPEMVANELCLIMEGIIFDWCIHDGSYDMAKYSTELISRLLPVLL